MPGCESPVAIAFGGACAGLGGAFLSLVIVPQWTEGMTAGRGWIALAIVVFASWRPLRVLAGAYESGDMQLIRNYDKAVAWLRAGVETRDLWSIQRLARAYRHGDLGLRIDEEKPASSKAWLRSCARRRNETACDFGTVNSRVY